MKIVVLVPAHNEEESIGATIESLLAQERKADQIVVIPNGCTDRTAEVAGQYPVTVLELPKLEHRKSEAMNRAWAMHAKDADIVVSVDADTILGPNAFGDWEKEAESTVNFGGSTSKFTVQQPGLLCRLQKAEYAMNIQQGLDKGWTNVLAGAGSAFSGTALNTLAQREDRVGPWSYTSAVEDYEITYRLRELGLKTYVSPTIRAYTDGMKDVKSLWGQRIKWQAGTLHDLVDFGVNKLTIRDWGAQMLALCNPAIRILWVVVMLLAIYLNAVVVVWWAFLIPLLSLAINVKIALRIPHKDRWDMFIAVLLVPTEALQCMRGAWILASWGEVVRKIVTKKNRDLWAAQYKAEGV